MTRPPYFLRIGCYPRIVNMENKRLVILLSILVGLEVIQVIEKIIEFIMR